MPLKFHISIFSTFFTHFLSLPIIRQVTSGLPLGFGLSRYRYYFLFSPLYSSCLGSCRPSAHLFQASQTFRSPPSARFLVTHLSSLAIFYLFALAFLDRAVCCLKPGCSASLEPSKSLSSVQRSQLHCYHERQTYSKNHADLFSSLFADIDVP